MKAVEKRTSAWNHDGGEALGRLGNQILGGHKLVIQPASPIPLTRVYVTVRDHYMNPHTPWFRNTQILPHRLRILGNPRSKSIDLQIPMQPGQTCLEAILLTLQIIGCQQGRMQNDSEGIQVFTTNHIPKVGPRHLEPTWSKHTGLPLLHHHSTFELSDRLTMFLPEEKNEITWWSACLAEDIEIRLADGTFATLQNSTGKAIWTDQQENRIIKRIHKFDTLETDPPLYGIGGNLITESHFIWERPESKWLRAFEARGMNRVKRKTPQGPVFAVELDTDDYQTLRGGIKAATFGNCLIVEPRRQGYTQDFRFKMDQALRRNGLQKAYITKWHHGGVGHRLDGSLILDTGRIKSPQRTNKDQGDNDTTNTPLLPKQRVYRECGRCRKPDAKLKCACLATHYCDTRCQREDMPEHRQECTYMTLKEINLIQSQLNQHKANHGKFTIEVARLELLSTETHITLADLLRSSGLGTKQKGSEYQYLQALQRVARLEKLSFLRERPSLLHNLKIDQAAAHLGLGSLYRDQHLLEKASEQLTQAHDLTQELISIADSPGQQDRLGVILTTHGEILNRRGQLQTSDQTTSGDSHTALDKQQRAVRIFRQLEQTTSGPLREQTLRKLMESLISMADTLENLELYEESQVAMQEARVIGQRAQDENITSSLHLHQQICACTKDTMDARRELDDHTSTLHVGSKIRLHGLLNQALNGKKGIVLGTGSNNRIGIQLQGKQRQVSIRIFNIRYWGDPEQNCHTLYDKMAAKAQIEIELLRLELQIQIKKSGNKNINTARARYNLGRALWLWERICRMT